MQFLNHIFGVATESVPALESADGYKLMIYRNYSETIEANWNIEWSTRHHPEYKEVIKKYKNSDNFPQNLNIVHYTHTPKPWNDKAMELADLWWSYARKSIFYEVILLKNMKG